MHPSVLALISVLCYSMAAVILEQKLAAYNSLLIVAAVGGTVCMFSLANFTLHGGFAEPTTFPSGVLLWWLLAACVFWYFADTFYVRSFTSGGSLHSITTIMLLLPVIAAVIRLGWIVEAPSFYQLGGYALVSAGTLLVIYGDQHGLK